MLGLIALLPLAVQAVLQTVPFDDPRILYSGSGWHADLFEIRAGIDPPTGGGVNGTSTPPVCALGDRGTSSGTLGAGFSFSFTGTALQLVMESRDDHGFVDVALDGVSAQVSAYSLAPHCGVLFEQSPLALGPHTVTVTLAAHNAASKWNATYVQLFAVRFDDGLGPSTTTTTTTTTNSATGAAGTSKGDAAQNTQVAHSNTGAIVGGVVGGILAGLALAALVTCLVVRRKRAAARPREQGLMHPAPWTPASMPATPAATGQTFYNNATSYYPSEPSEPGGAPPTEVASGFASSYPMSAPSIHRSASAVGTLHDEDVERIADRLVQLVQQGQTPSVYGSDYSSAEPTPFLTRAWADLPPPPPVPQKQLYRADAPAVNRAQGGDEPPPAY